MNIKVLDELTPEDGAMLQALYSRSADSVDVHLKKVESTGSGKFMQNYYVGYGHRSIADCGSTTIFIEGVSMLAAKAIQDWPLYSGQETSTRYIDMGKQGIYDPRGNADTEEILGGWMDFYKGNQDEVSEVIRAKYPRKEGEDEKVYERAVKARTFDVMRGFLPAGIKTQLSWHTNLRQAADHLTWMRHHPLAEVQVIALQIANALNVKYPSSGFDRLLAGVGSSPENQYERSEWYSQVTKHFTYETPDGLSAEYDDVWMDSGIVIWGRYRSALETRPKGCVLPHRFADLGTANFEFLLDFGSFRDLQRHRNGVIRMPLLTTELRFEEWYLEELGSLRTKAEALIAIQKTRLDALKLNEFERQYLIPMGYRVSCEVTMALPALVYFMELRSGKTIHPTLRKKVHGMIREFQKVHTEVKLHVDMDPDDWDVRRGTQTISERSERTEA